MRDDQTVGVSENFSADLKKQLASIRPIVFTIGVIALFCAAGVWGLSRIFEESLSSLTRDPLAVSHAGFYIGLLSNLGALLWAAATGICFFGSYLLNRSTHRRRQARFLFWSGTLSLTLTLDDVFQLHEDVFPHLLHIPEDGVYLGYFLIITGYLLYAFRRIMKTDYLLFLLACISLGLSLGADKLLPLSDREIFLEDGLKFIGILFWLAFFVRAAAGMATDSSIRSDTRPTDRD